MYKKIIISIVLLISTIQLAIANDAGEIKERLDNYEKNFQIERINPDRDFLNSIDHFLKRLEGVKFFKGPGNLIGFAGYQIPSHKGSVGYFSPDGKWFIAGAAVNFEKGYEQTRVAAILLLPDSDLAKMARNEIGKVKSVVAEKQGVRGYGVKPVLALLQSSTYLNQRTIEGNAKVWVIADPIHPLSKTIFNKLSSKHLNARWLLLGASAGSKGIIASIYSVNDKDAEFKRYMNTDQWKPTSKITSKAVDVQAKNTAILQQQGITRGPMILIESSNELKIIASNDEITKFLN